MARLADQMVRRGRQFTGTARLVSWWIEPDRSGSAGPVLGALRCDACGQHVGTVEDAPGGGRGVAGVRVRLDVGGGRRRRKRYRHLQNIRCVEHGRLWVTWEGLEPYVIEARSTRRQFDLRAVPV